jgi:cytoskeletal protein CcmA (bactofilin family)
MSIFSKNSNSNSNSNSAETEEPIAQEIEAQVEASVPAEEPPVTEQTMRSEFAGRPSVLANKPSIISEGFTFEGTITSDGVLNISGTVRGKITAKSVLIDSSGQVDGELNSDQLVIKGQLHGDVNCEDLNVGPMAKVDGNISYKYIHIQRGGRVSGKFIKN